MVCRAEGMLWFSLAIHILYNKYYDIVPMMLTTVSAVVISELLLIPFICNRPYLKHCFLNF